MSNTVNLVTTSMNVIASDADAVVVGVHSDGDLAGPAAALNQATDGLLSRLRTSGDLNGKPCELTTLWSPPGIAAPLTVVVGLGPRDEFDRGMAYRAAAAASRQLAKRARGAVAYHLGDGWSSDQRAAAVAGSLVGCRGQDLYRNEKTLTPPGEIRWPAGDDEALRRGEILGDAVNLTRRLVNEPPDVIYPESFAEQTAAVGAESGFEVEIWDRPRLEQERADSLLAVAKGSNRDPRLVIMRHQGGAKGAAPLALVGKGVTFDSGGLSLKPNDGMKTMKCDMAGAATVVGAMQAIARLKLPVNVVGLVGLVENLPSGTAMKLGDVLTARNGRTIEVQNTDAEGRLVLADVLAVAVDLGVKRIIDLATLTGACVVALGTDVVGMMTNDEAWCGEVRSAAERTGERVWPLPMFPEFRDLIKSEVADIRNTGEGRWGGAITAAKFLEEFVAGTPWVHLDIAGPAFADKPKPWLEAGATGAMVRTLVETCATLKD